MKELAAFFGTAALAIAAIAWRRGGAGSCRAENGPRDDRSGKRAPRRESGDSSHARPFIIGVAGASGSGKTTVCTRILDALADKGQRVAIISSDAYYKSLDGKDPTTYNFDEPAAIDFDYLHSHLRQLKRGEQIEVPNYDFVTHSRMAKTTSIGDVDVVIIEGILVLFHEALRSVMDVRLFALEDPDVCLVRRLRRDLLERGRSVESVLQQYEQFVKPSYEAFVRPSMEFADIIVPRAGTNSIAVKILLREIKARMGDDLGISIPP